MMFYFSIWQGSCFYLFWLLGRFPGNADSLKFIYSRLLFLTEKEPACVCWFPGLGCHFPAGFCAFKAGFGTFLAMVVVMLLAFIAAGFANFCTQAADLVNKVAVRLHRSYCHAAYFGTFPVHSDALCHHFYILLF
jgi:hypothetical protein